MKLDRYKALDLPVGEEGLLAGWIQDLPGEKAQTLVSRILSERETRIEQLQALLEDEDVCLDDSRECIEGVNEWIMSASEPRPDNPRKVAEPWYSIAVDISLWYGEILIEERPSLHWCIEDDPDNLNHRLPVIRGFRNVKNARYHICPLRKVSQTVSQAARLKVLDEYRATLPSDLAKSLHDAWLEDVRSGRIKLESRLWAAFESSLEIA